MNPFLRITWVQQPPRWLEGKFIWQFSQLCCMGMLSQDEVDLCHLVLGHLRGLNYHIVLVTNIDLQRERERERERERDFIIIFGEGECFLCIFLL